MNVELAVINVCLLCLLTVPHEFAHAWVADRLGDDTPAREGRLTLYPPAHIDWLGTIILPALMTLFGGGIIGWGRPVNTNPAKLRFGMRGLALVALAGPASNVLMTLLFSALAAATAQLFAPVREFAARAAWLSMYLAIFNLLPVPPLDGSKLLLAARLPRVIYQELARFGFILLLVLMSATRLGDWIAGWSYDATRVCYRLFGVI